MSPSRRRRHHRPLTPTSCALICTVLSSTTSTTSSRCASAAAPLTFVVPRHLRFIKSCSTSSRRMQSSSSSSSSQRPVLYDTIENTERDESNNFNNTHVLLAGNYFNLYGDVTTKTSKSYTAFINAIDALSTKRNVVRDLRKNASDLITVKEYMFNTKRVLPRWDVNDYLLPLSYVGANINNDDLATTNNGKKVVEEEEGINNYNIDTSSTTTTTTTISLNLKQSIRLRSEQFLSTTNLTSSQYRLASVLIAHLADDCARTSNVDPIYIAWEKILECGMTPLSRTLSTFLYVLGLPPSANEDEVEEEEEEVAAVVGRRRRDAIATEVAMYHDAIYSPTEKTIAILVKSLVARGDAKGAEALLDGIPSPSSSSSAESSSSSNSQQLLLRHRTTSPILKLYCDQGDIESALRLYRRMRQTSRVKMDTTTYVDFIAAVAKNGYFRSDSKGVVLPAVEEQETMTSIMRGPELLNLLISEMAEDVLDIYEEMAGVLREGFMAGFQKCCDVVSDNNGINAGTMLSLDSGECATNMMMTPLTTRCHDNQSLIANRVSIDKNTALCSATGVKLRFMILDNTQRVHVHDTLLDMAREKSMEYTSRLAAKGRSTTDNVKAAETASQILREFSEWLDTRDGPPYTAIVDGANVAYFGWGRVNVYQLVHMVNELERRGEYPLVIFPQKYTNQRFHLRRGMMQVLRDEEMEALEGLKAKGQMYVVPPMCLDDLYWMLASVSKQTFSTGGRNIDVLPDESNNNSSPNHGRYPGLRPMVISNDKMRDHRLELPLEERAFRRWCTSHIVNYNFTEYVEDSTEERTITFSAAGLFSDEIQGNLCPEVIQGASEEESDGDIIMAWHFPVSEWDDSERFCLRLPLTTTTATTTNSISTTTRLYTPPLHSESFLQHLENVKSSWKPDSSDDDVGGVPCFGEPTIDPSRMVQNSIVDGDSNWI